MSVYVFTSVTTNYIPKARVLAQTLKRHNPSVRFVMFIAEPLPVFDSSAPDCFDEIVPIEALDIPQRQQWVFKHSVVEICTAIKGYALQNVLKRPDCEAVFYIDPDIGIFAPLTPLLDMFATASILLTPHLLHPEEVREAVLDNEVCALQHGIYNLGFIGVKNDTEGRAFAEWWAARLEEFCFDDIPNGIFTDQRWIDFVPAFFSGYAVVRHPGCNVATWNLSHRMVEGDFQSGFTVNGQPLVFYHFSGFDSGAQLAMLSKYGSHMPAAFTLRDWYIKTCEENDPERFATVPWTFSFFENGRPISADHRKLFRERYDLQAQFPDPFATTDPSHSYYDWYLAHATGAGSIMHDLFEIRQQAFSDTTPLNYFLEHSAEMKMVSPTPYFDCEYYLRTYPDIAEVGVHPYLHFLAYGYKEDRNPSSEFNTRYYIEHNKHLLRPGENPLLHFATVGQALGLRANRLYRAEQDRAIIQQWLRALDPDQPTVLMVGHFMDGGVGAHVRQMAAFLAGVCNVLLLHPTYDGDLSLSVMNRPKLSDLFFHPQRQFDDLTRILRTLNISHVHIHHLWGNEVYLRALVDRLDVPIALTLHDYYLLAPQPHLCDEKGMFVGDPIEQAEEVLVKNALTEEGTSVISLADWQARHRWVMERRGVMVIAPSRDVVTRFKHVYPSRSIIVAPHLEDGDPGEVAVRLQPMSADEPLRIVIIGTISPQKGAQTIITCASLADLVGAPVEFHMLGGFSPDIETPSISCLHEYGAYDNKQLPAMLRKIRPHIAWLPSICPETYSYVLSETMRNGLPVAATDLGAIPERLAGRPWSWIAPWRQSAYEWLRFFQEIRRQHFIPGLAPQVGSVIAASGDSSGDFYHKEYLDWIHKVAMPEGVTL